MTTSTLTKHSSEQEQSQKFIQHRYTSLLSSISFFESIASRFVCQSEEDAIYTAIVDEFKRSEEFDCTLYLLSDNESELHFFGSSIQEQLRQKIYDTTGCDSFSTPIILDNTILFRDVLINQNIYHASSESVIKDTLPETLKSFSSTITDTLNYTDNETLLIPFIKLGHPTGIIVITMCNFFSDITLIIESFSRHLSFTLERVFETRQSRKVEDALRANKVKLSNALQIARLGHWEYDIEKDLFIFNDEFYKIFRTSAEDVGGYTMSSARYAELFLHPDDAQLVAEEVEAALEATDPHFVRQLEHRIIFPDKSIGIISVRIFGIKNVKGRRIKTYGVNQDITERRKAEKELNEYRHQLEELVSERTEELRKELLQRQKAEEELQKAQKLESLGMLAGGIAHDFNNLLGGLFGFIDLTRRTLDDTAAARESLDDAMDCLSRAKDLTQQLLTFAKGGMPVKKCLKLEPLLTKTIKLSLSGSTIECTRNIPSDLFAINGDEGQLSQVFSNVLLNSRQSMPDGGCIVLSANNEELHGNNPFNLHEGLYVKISITDHGSGIANSDIKKVFDPFFTTKPGGSGLGLAMSYSIINKHNGHIAIDSVTGKGTTVSIYLPSCDDEISEQPSQKDSILAGNSRILLMDDEAAICKSVSCILKQSGYAVTCTGNGEEAIAAYKEALSNGSPFAIVILDLTVVGGMGGEKAIRILKEIDPKVKGIVSSGYGDSPVVSDPPSFGFSGTIVKPYVAEKLIETINEVLVK